MRPHAECTTVTTARAPRTKQPTCPRCGDCLVAPTEAAFAGEGRIWHTWSCDNCDHEFMTCVDLRS